jgi:hypothetical protein
MKKMLVAVALAVVPLTISPAPAKVRPANLAAALPAPPSEPVCIVILGKVICW